MKSKTKYCAPLISMIVTLGVLITSVFALFGTSLGWFSSNTSAGASGISINVKGVPLTEEYFVINGVRADENATDIFSDLRPGQTVTADLHIKNNDDEAIRFTLIMSAPGEENDTPYVKNDLYYYFGSQIRLNSITQNGTDKLILSGRNKFLLPLSESLYKGGMQPTSIGSEFDFSTLSSTALMNTIEIAAGEELVFTLSFEFVDNGENQNAYIYFGNPLDEEKASLNLSRTLICEYDFVD